MSEQKHPWSHDPARDAAARRKEDEMRGWRRLEVGEVVQAGDEYQEQVWPKHPGGQRWHSVPEVCVGKPIDSGHLPHRRRVPSSPQHRDLPEAVAALTERVARLEAAQATICSGDEIARLTAELDAARRERDEAVDDGETLRMSLTACDVIANSNTSQSLSCNKIIYPNYDCEAVQSVIRAVEREIALRDRVSELERERDAAVQEREYACRAAESLREQPAEIALITAERDLARAVRDGLRSQRDAARARVAELEAAPPPRGWLTEEERKAVDAARDYFDDDNHGDSECVFIARMLKQLLARSSPPRVRKVNCLLAEETHDLHAWKLAETMWIAAIRDAGGEVEG